MLLRLQCRPDQDVGYVSRSHRMYLRADGRGEPSSPAAKTEALARPDALLTPSYRGDADRVAELIKLKADLHATDALGNCPLHLAAFNGHIKVIRSERVRVKSINPVAMVTVYWSVSQW